MSEKTSLRILVAPLDWGLGHVTRCVPVIQHLIDKEHIVIIAGNDLQTSYLRSVFPNQQYLFLEGYDISYSKNALAFMPRLLAQVPTINNKIKQEHRWLQNQVKEQSIDAVISDNRYGLYHSSIPCVFMTHQLHVLSGWGKIADYLLQLLHYKYIGKFGECWVVDSETDPGLGGILSHPRKLPKIRTSYTGPLSQCYIPGEERAEPDGDKYILVLLSGPEPQRSILSALLWQQAIQLQRNIVFIEGSEQAAEPPFIPKHIKYFKRLATPDVKTYIQKAELIVCRSGYSTIMDLIELNKKAILIPTPGQTEQEYLARELHKQGIFYTAYQKGFDLSHALDKTRSFPFTRQLPEHDFSLYKKVIDKWLR